MSNTVLVAEGCRELDIGTVRHYAGMHGRGRDYAQGGIFRDLTDAEARAVVASAGGYIVPPGTPAPRGVGYRCGECGHGSYFKRCGQCGNEECAPE